MLIEIIFWGALAVIAGALADKAEKQGRLAKMAIFMIIACLLSIFCLGTGFAWMLQFKGVL